MSRPNGIRRRFATSALLMLSLCGCFIEQPAVTDPNRRLASIEHTGNLLVSCLPCHANKLPTTLVNEMDHSAKPAAGDCVLCHVKNAGVVWSGGIFKHPTNLQTCASCHKLQVPSSLFKRFDHSTVDVTQCATCHTQPGLMWSGAKFHAHTPTPFPVPSSCVGCHRADRPTTVVNGFDHTAGTAATADCVSCHTQPGTTWATGAFNHTPTPTSCNACHQMLRPDPATLLPTGKTVDLYEHASNFKGTADCVGCHTSVSANVGVSWAGGNYDHKQSTGAAINTCLPCHAGNRPLTTVNGFDHTTVGDCATCHTSPGVTWAGGTGFNHTPLPTSCLNCHINLLPGATTLLPAGATVDLYEHALNFNGGTDCVTCHTAVPANAGVTWAGGAYNHKDNTGASVSTCIPCHNGNRPTGPVPTSGSPTFDHANNGGTGDCAGCHAKPGVTWSGGVYNHSPIPTSCGSCHAQEVPTGTVPNTVDGFNHKYGSDCASCHTTNIGVSWAGGTYKHTPPPSPITCLPCHSTRHHNQGQECANCHSPFWWDN